jgi:hypothetical protein
MPLTERTVKVRDTKSSAQLAILAPTGFVPSDMEGSAP